MLFTWTKSSEPVIIESIRNVDIILYYRVVNIVVYFIHPRQCLFICFFVFFRKCIQTKVKRRVRHAQLNEIRLRNTRGVYVTRRTVATHCRALLTPTAGRAVTAVVVVVYNRTVYAFPQENPCTRVVGFFFRT